MRRGGVDERVWWTCKATLLSLSSAYTTWLDCYRKGKGGCYLIKAGAMRRLPVRIDVDVFCGLFLGGVFFTVMNSRQGYY